MQVLNDGTDTGEPEARFDDAFERLAALAYRVAKRLLVSGGDAENVAAETLARAQHRWKAVSDHAEPWVVTVATRLAVREARRSQRGHPVHSPGPSSDRADDVAVRVDLARALRTLSRRQRQAVALKYLGDLSDADAASAMGCSVPSFRTHCSRGLAALQTQLGAAPRLGIESAGGPWR